LTVIEFNSPNFPQIGNNLDKLKALMRCHDPDGYANHDENQSSRGKEA